MIRRIPWVAAALSAFLFVLPLAADEKTKPAQAEEKSKEGVEVVVAHTFRASDIMDMDVRNTKGKEVGAISDLVVELNSGEIRYAALSFGGFAGFGDKLFAVPWKAIQFKFDEDDHYLVVDVSQEKLENAEGFDEEHWPNVGDPKWAASVDKSFAGAEGEAADKEKDAEAKEEKEAKQSVPDGKSGTKTAGDKIVYDAVYRVSSLKGMEVRNEAGKDLGQINELVFDLRKGKVAYAALSHGGVLGVGDKLFAVPFDAFKLKHKADEKFLVLNIPEEKLANAPGFDENHWPDTVDPKWAEEIDRHYEISRKPKDGDVKRE
jgi:sporulation protein YlmC with PRC-barrel domain